MSLTMILVGWMRMNRVRSVSFRLPVLISVLLLATVGVSSWLAYRGVKETLMLAAVDRLGFAEQLAELMEDPIALLLEGGATIAANPALREFVFRPEDQVGQTLTQNFTALLSAPEALSVEVRDIEGALLLTVGEDVEPSPIIAEGRTIKAGVSPLYLADDEVLYDTVVPIPGESTDSAPVGWLILRREISTGGALAELLAGMVGHEARLVIGNADSTGPWTDLVGSIPEIPVTYTEGEASHRYASTEGEFRIIRGHPIPRTPWVIWMEQSEGVILDPAYTFLEHLWPSALLLVLLGTLLAWALTRGVTDSIVRLASATRGFAEGDFGQRMHLSRKDEIGYLASAFNQMAEQIGLSHHALEERVQERTIALRETNRRLEEKQDELVRAERLATLGQLASGVGHELRNPLGVMTNAVYYLEVILSEAPETVREYLGILKGQIGLSEKIVGDLLDFARLKPPQVELVQVEAIVDLQVQRLGHLSNVSVSKELPADLPLVAVDPIQIGQVVLNVLMNGVQAMTDSGGTLHIRARAVGDRVELSVTDEGDGIAPELIEKIFEPLFTTKARGIGLGLAVSRALAEGNGGSLVAGSIPGEGATFILSLPTRTMEAAA